eukprot:487364_1
MRVHGKGVKAVQALASKLNLCVNNPCVVLKQTTAKQLLNSTRNTDKFKFFMDASKLGSFEEAMRDAKQQLQEAVTEQRSSKDSFHVIAERYKECKQQYDMLVNKQEQEQTVAFWNTAEAWMRYHREHKTLEPLQNEIENIEFKIQSANETKTQKEEELHRQMQRAQDLKAEIEKKSEESERFTEPINVLKGEMAALNGKRAAAARKASSNQRFVDKARRKIKDYKRQYQEAVQASQNNERAQQLATLQTNLTQAGAKLQELRTQREPLQQKIEPTIEMKENESKLNSLETRRTYASDELKQIQSNIRNLSQNRDQSDMFLYRPARQKRITMKQIRQEIQRHHRKFSVQPIGPLGEYIQMVPQRDQDRERINIQIVQNVLQSSLNVFLVSSTADQHLFGEIMKRRFGMKIPCIQYRCSDRKNQPNANPFVNYRFRDDQNSRIVRV